MLAHSVKDEMDSTLFSLSLFTRHFPFIPSLSLFGIDTLSASVSFHFPLTFPVISSYVLTLGQHEHALLYPSSAFVATF